ncbi:hypothetical protein [Paraburkholderia bannensis]|uniref:hypothetical protein n=1 Tax=Paraburkholderia bannensis TaxID=765414 RepID=UPI00047F19A2|nr:hypothetical protein [Paraburkholderia bannensis]
MSNPRRKPHNTFTNHEVALIREHWPTRMPMTDLLALLPRHTENSITGYANKKLGLKRPSVRTIRPAWERVRAMLEQEPMTQVEIASAMGFSRTRACEILKLNRESVHIVAWRWPEAFGRAEALWALVSAPDAPEPMGAKRLRRGALRRANPFLAAAGLVQAPAGRPGRVYKQSMSVNDEEQAA